MKSETIICDICGAAHPAAEDLFFDGKHLCLHCNMERTVRCRCCDERIWREDAVDGDLCMRCFDDYYLRCSECGRVIASDEACYTSADYGYHDNPYCEDCYNQLDDEPIHDYSYKPEPIFYGNGKRFYGIELEIDEGGEYQDNAQRLLDIANFPDERIYIKHDGSIEEGFEIVSHPMTLDYHKSKMPWEPIMRRAVSMGYTSHMAETCGLHIHINRDSFGATYDEQECAAAKILYFYEKFWDEILKFSRRTERQAAQWANRYGGGLVNPHETLQRAKMSHKGRYMAVNLENYSTIEMRIFRGTLKYSTFLATLQFVDSICDVAFSLSDEELQRMTWLDFVQRIPSDKPELIDYLKSRRLYVNEPTTAEEEI